MPHLAPVSAKKLIKFLLREGFICVRTRGSHNYFINHTKGKTAVVPIHGNRDIGVGLLRTILHDIDMPVEEFNRKIRE